MPITTLPEPRHLELDHGHHMAWFSVGDEGAPPLLILHGGPGARSRAASLNWFDGLGLRCIAFDQRGCGASTPAGGCDHNTLVDLVADIERLREHLGLSHWAVAGGSWGALLAVAYAAAHPARVDGLFLRSPFLGSASEVDAFFAPWPRWLGADGAALLGLAPSEPVPDPVQWLQVATEPTRRGLIASAWQAFEQAQSAPGGLRDRPDLRWALPALGAVVPSVPPGLAVQQHYLQHGCFVDAEQRAMWLNRLDAALADRPVSLVHGLDDVVCAPAVGQALAARWPQAVGHWVAGAGHDMDHPLLRAALVDAAAAWVPRLGTNGHTTT